MKKIYILALLVALLAGFATFYFARQIEEKTNIKDAPTATVVVALVDIPANTQITEEMVALKTYTQVSITPGTATTLEDVLEKAAKYPIVAGEQIVMDKVMTVGSSKSTGSLSFQLEEGKYAYTISVGTETGISGYICANDYVDIIITNPVKNADGSTFMKSTVLMSNVKVIKLSSYSANLTAEANGTVVNSYSDVTLCITLDQCLTLTEEQANGGTLGLVLKSILSGKEEAGEDIEETTATPSKSATTELAG